MVLMRSICWSCPSRWCSAARSCWRKQQNKKKKVRNRHPRVFLHMKVLPFSFFDSPTKCMETANPVSSRMLQPWSSRWYIWTLLAMCECTEYNSTICATCSAPPLPTSHQSCFQCCFLLLNVFSKLTVLCVHWCEEILFPIGLSVLYRYTLSVSAQLFLATHFPCTLWFVCFLFNPLPPQPAVYLFTAFKIVSESAYRHLLQCINNTKSCVILWVEINLLRWW